MLKKKWLALYVMAAFIVSLTVPKAEAAALFQAEKFPIQQMQIQVMPEFDYPENWPTRDIPSLLIGQYGTIINKSGQDFDGKIELTVPSKEKGFSAFLVAEFPEENKPEVARPYDVDQEKGIISWKPAKPIKNNQSYKFVIEYYTQTIDVKDKKSFTYVFKNRAQIDQLDVIYYAPMNAKEIEMSPKAQEHSKNEYGEELYFYQYKNVKAGEGLKYSFSYKKDDTESTMEAMSKEQAAANGKQSGENGSATDQLANETTASSKHPLIGIGGASIIGIAIMIAGIFVYLGLKTAANKQTPAQVIKGSKTGNADAKKELRKKLLSGKMDQETYEEEMKKLM